MCDSGMPCGRADCANYGWPDNAMKLMDLEETHDLDAVPVMRTIGPSPALAAVTRIQHGYGSPLFRAAMAALRQDQDQLAVLCVLGDDFPKASLPELCQAIRETAVMFAHAGVKPVVPE